MARKIRGQTSQEVLDKLADEGVSPVEVMVRTMRRLYREHDECVEKLPFIRSDEEIGNLKNMAIERLKEACEIAKDVAPYFHPRLQAVTVAGEDGGAIQLELTSVAELRKFLRGEPPPVEKKPEGE